MGLVAVFWPLMTTGPGELVVQPGERRFVVDCRGEAGGIGGAPYNHICCGRVIVN